MDDAGRKGDTDPGVDAPAADAEAADTSTTSADLPTEEHDTIGSDTEQPDTEQPDTEEHDIIGPDTEEHDTIGPDTEVLETAGPDTEALEVAVPTSEVAAVDMPAAPTEQMPAATPTPTPTPTPTTEYPVVPVAAAAPAPAQPGVDIGPRVFDGADDLAQFPVPREPFRLRVVFLLSLFGAGAMLMTIVANVVDIRTSRPIAGIVTGSRLLDDIASNLAFAGFVGAAVLVIGSLLACFGLRWGAGLAGGAGLALVGWAALSIGLAELPIASAESITLTSTSPEPFTLRVTRDIGWWLIVGLGAVGAVVFLSSLRWTSSGRRRPLNPMVAALIALAIALLACGPLVPVGAASIADNFRSTDPSSDLPTAFFVGRLAQVGLIALAGVVGALIVRSYGLGLAAGGVSVSAWLWASSYAEVGPSPVGIGQRNPGATSTLPHAVTTVAMVATLVLLVLAAGLATWRLNRARP